MESEDRLAVVLSEFARTLLTDFPIQGILDHLVRRIVDLLPIDAAGVSLISPTTHPRLIAGSDELAIRYERLQTSLDEGPCVAAYESGGAVAIPDLGADVAFPRFAERAVAEGLAAVFTFPLRSDDRSLGALDLYRTTTGELDAQDMATAQTLADVATAYLLNAESRTERSRFVATVSHELRTPLTNILGFAELLQDHEGGPLTERQEELVGAISRNGARLSALASDLLAVSTQEDGPASSHYAAVDLVGVVRDVEQSLGPAVAARDLKVTFATPSEPVPVLGHAADLGAVVTNLVGNALKFTEDGGWVRCDLGVVQGCAHLEVSDNGLGIPRAEQRDLFTRFFRSSTAQEHLIEGTGLGLSIVESIVDNHGGTISVQSEHLRGSTFTVTVPLHAGPVGGASAGHARGQHPSPVRRDGGAAPAEVPPEPEPAIPA